MRVLSPSPQCLMFVSGVERCHKRAGGAVTERGYRAVPREDHDGGTRRSVTAFRHIAMAHSALPWVWRGRRYARFHTRFRLHRARRSDRMHACGGSESFAATSLIIEAAGSGERSSRLDQAPRVTNFLIEMI